MSKFSGKNIYVNQCNAFPEMKMMGFEAVNSLDETRGVITWNNGNIYIGGIKLKDGTWVRDGRGIMKTYACLLPYKFICDWIDDKPKKKGQWFRNLFRMDNKEEETHF